MRELDAFLTAATAQIADLYFRLPIAEGPSVYRERVYCYELYHQLRVQWPDNTAFTLNGEVDKSGHPLLRELEADRCKPDLLVHIPGDMNGNFAVIEVKSSNAQRREIRKDLRTLALFTTKVGYRRAIYLIFGHEAEQAGRRALTEMSSMRNTQAIELWLHCGVGTPATPNPAFNADVPWAALRAGPRAAG